MKTRPNYQNLWKLFLICILTFFFFFFQMQKKLKDLPEKNTPGCAKRFLQFWGHKCLPPSGENNNVEKNGKFKELENTVKEMAEKIDQLEVKLKDMESKYVGLIKTKEAVIKVVDIEKFQNRKGIFKCQKENKSKPKEQVFKFGAVTKKL